MENKDAELIDSYLSGNDDALKEIIDKYTPQIYNFVRHFVVVGEADDIVQEVFIKVWKSFKKFNIDKSSFKTWIFTIARNTVIDFMRKRRSVLFSSLDNEETFSESIKDEAILPDEVLQKLQDADLLNSLLEKLSEQYRTVLILHYQEEMTFDEISQVLQKPLNTVKSQHLRAISVLKNLVAPKV